MQTSLSGVLLAAVIVSGCGSSPTYPTSPEAFNTAGDVVGIVSDNHDRPHVAIISAAQLAAAAPIDLNISNGLHSHTVVLTGAQVGQIAAGTQVSVTSTTDPHSNGMDRHSHSVTFR